MSYKGNYIKIYNMLIGGNSYETEKELTRLLEEHGFTNIKHNNEKITIYINDKEYTILNNLDKYNLSGQDNKPIAQFYTKKIDGDEYGIVRFFNENISTVETTKTQTHEIDPTLDNIITKPETILQKGGANGTVGSLLGGLALLVLSRVIEPVGINIFSDQLTRRFLDDRNEPELKRLRVEIEKLMNINIELHHENSKLNEEILKLNGEIRKLNEEIRKLTKRLMKVP